MFAIKHRYIYSDIANSHTEGPEGVVHLPGTSRDSKIGIWKWNVSLYGSSARGK
jgi:hypothetical protein